MKGSSLRIKAICSLAIIVVVALFAIIIFQLVQISSKQRELAEKQAEIEKIQQELEYYESQEASNQNQAFSVSIGE